MSNTSTSELLTGLWITSALVMLFFFLAIIYRAFRKIKLHDGTILPFALIVLSTTIPLYLLQWFEKTPLSVPNIIATVVLIMSAVNLYHYTKAYLDLI
jgi:uncharacterized membrane protein YoaK (UPF0700 family)